MRRLPERAARHGEVWNWALAAQHGGMSKRDVTSLVQRIGLRQRAGVIVDPQTLKTFGSRTQEAGEGPPPGPPDIGVSRYMIFVPGFLFGTLIQQG